MTPEQKFKESGLLEDYLVIPFGRRSYWSVFYKTPPSLRSGQWKLWTKHTKAKFPVQYFMREFVWDEIKYLWRRVKDVKYYLINRFWRRTHILDLGNVGQYQDCDYKIEKSLEVLFLDFYQNEYLDGYVNWEVESVLNSRIKEIYNFFTEIRPRKQREIDGLEEELYGFSKSNDLDDILDIINNQSPDRMSKNTQLFELEDELDKEHTKYLQMIVEIRKSLWT